jgi:hypothetical protein
LIIRQRHRGHRNAAPAPSYIDLQASCVIEVAIEWVDSFGRARCHLVREKNGPPAQPRARKGFRLAPSRKKSGFDMGAPRHAEVFLKQRGGHDHEAMRPYPALLPPRTPRR